MNPKAKKCVGTKWQAIIAIIPTSVQASLPERINPETNLKTSMT